MKASVDEEEERQVPGKFGGRCGILRRRGASPPAPDGEWVLPKGDIEEGESNTDAAVREVQEETGLRVAATEPLGATQYRFTNESGSLVHKTVHWFLIECEGGDPAIEPSFRQGRFVLPEEAL
jgi:8-oxo-dGTP pyrophosphatase MutT (NUDIX family)